MAVLGKVLDKGPGIGAAGAGLDIGGGVDHAVGVGDVKGVDDGRGVVGAYADDGEGVDVHQKLPRPCGQRFVADNDERDRGPRGGRGLLAGAASEVEAREVRGGEGAPAARPPRQLQRWWPSNPP
ncbi:hypothetical protein ZWY2020_017028 [Hordeum vulgare]|nr:hypothetical protein ZWY2020_017028 [Hordeum vulgare]